MGHGLATEKEESRPRIAELEGVEHEGGRVLVGTVVEGQYDIPRRYALDAGVLLPPASPARMPLVQPLTGRLGQQVAQVIDALS